jgi:hypothetical protein
VCEEEEEESEEFEEPPPPPARRYTTPRRAPARVQYVPPLQAELDQMLVDSVGYMRQSREAQKRAAYAELALQAFAT